MPKFQNLFFLTWKDPNANSGSIQYIIEKVLLTFSAVAFTPDDLERLPLGYQIPIKEVLHHHKNMDQTNMNLQTAIFLGKFRIFIILFYLSGRSFGGNFLL